MLSRNSLRLALALALPLAACASDQAARQCYPVASWAAPAFRCASGAPAPVVAEPVIEPMPEEPEVQVNAETIDLKERVQFENDSAVLLDASRSLLDDVARTITEHPELVRIRIEGHTDDKADDRHNQRLSKRRADAVRNYLIEHGVAASRLEAKGFGESRPIADNSTEEGREQNRRVELHIVERAP
ncbi:MAG: OmpA family protein [Kofleriaceae bacterium]